MIVLGKKERRTGCGRKVNGLIYKEKKESDDSCLELNDSEREINLVNDFIRDRTDGET